MVGRGRFELPTSPLSGVRSNQRSYRPISETGRSEKTKINENSFDLKALAFQILQDEGT